MTDLEIAEKAEGWDIDHVIYDQEDDYWTLGCLTTDDPEYGFAPWMTLDCANYGFDSNYTNLADFYMRFTPSHITKILKSVNRVHSLSNHMSMELHSNARLMVTVEEHEIIAIPVSSYKKVTDMLHEINRIT